MRRVSRSSARLPRHRPRRYHVRPAQRVAAVETAKVTTMLRLPAFPACAPAPRSAGTTGIGTPPWLARTQRNSVNSAQGTAAMAYAITVVVPLGRVVAVGRAGRSAGRGWGWTRGGPGEGIPIGPRVRCSGGEG